MRSVLLNYAKDMVTNSAHSYYYKHNQQMNYIKGDEGIEMPFVDSGLDKLCISTKTEQMMESDDSFNELLLISTKTFAQMESDDLGTIIDK